MRARAITPLLLLVVTGWAATPALATVECRAMPTEARVACPPPCPHCKKAEAAKGPGLSRECCIVRAAPAAQPAEPGARKAHAPDVAIVALPAFFQPRVAHLSPVTARRAVPFPPPLQVNRPLLR